PASLAGSAMAAAASLPQPPLGLERPPLGAASITRPAQAAATAPSPSASGPLGRPPMIGGTTLRGAGGPVVTGAGPAVAVAAARSVPASTRTVLGLPAQAFPSASRVAMPFAAPAPAASTPPPAPSPSPATSRAAVPAATLASA